MPVPCELRSTGPQHRCKSARGPDAELHRNILIYFISEGARFSWTLIHNYWAEITAGELFGDIDVDYATTVANSAIRSMSQPSVPATPSNFSVWFDYTMGTSPL